MGKWKSCCRDWFRTQQPKNPQEGRFQETHHCPSCGTPLDIIFECEYPFDSQTAQGYGEDFSELKCKLIAIQDRTP